MELFSHACRGDVQSLSELFERNTYPQKSLNIALQMAAEIGKLQTVQLLVSKGADVFSDDNYAMYLACKNNQNDIVQYFFTLGCFPVKIKNE